MKVKNFNEFVNEANMVITRTVTNGIGVSVSFLRSMWDGERWYYFDREGKGTLEDFKALENNRNTNFDVRLRFEFSLLDGNMEYDDDICSTTVEARVHFHSMEDDDYETSVISIDNIEELKEFTSTCEDGFDLHDFRTTLVKTWEEAYVDDEITDELEDALGKQDYSSMLVSLMDTIVDGLCEKLVR